MQFAIDKFLASFQGDIHVTVDWLEFACEMSTTSLYLFLNLVMEGLLEF